MRARWTAFLVAVAIVAYGSLYPFDFSRGWPAEGIARRFLESIRHSPGRGDILANLLLYLPIGFLAARLPSHAAGWRRVAGAAAVGAAMSGTIELLQVFDVGRYASLFDIALNALSALLGGVAAARWRLAVPWGAFRPAEPVAWVIALCWPASRLFPFVPLLDRWHLNAALQPLRHFPLLSPGAVVQHAVAWITFAMLVHSERNEGIPGSRPLLCLAAAGVLLAIPWTVGRPVVPEELAGAAAAVLVWMLFASQIARWPLLVAGLAAAAAIYSRYAPEPGRRGALIAGLFQAMFWCGAVLWLLRRHLRLRADHRLASRYSAQTASMSTRGGRSDNGSSKAS